MSQTPRFDPGRVVSEFPLLRLQKVGPRKDMGSPGTPWERSKAPGKSSRGRFFGLVYSDQQWGVVI